jgi:hypothetical protein
VVTGEAGDRIQRWREVHDAEQASRLPPHTTLCYWTPQIEPDLLGRQVRHAFAKPVTVKLSEVREFDNDQHTFYVELLNTTALNDARKRLYDGKHVALPGFREWEWHVTCVRESLGRDLVELRQLANGLRIDSQWRIDTVVYLELRGDRYEPLASWCL